MTMSPILPLPQCPRPLCRRPAGAGPRAFTRPGFRLGLGFHFTNALGGAGAGRLAAVPPDGNAASGVIVVGPDQELQTLAAELEMRGQLVDGAPAVLRRPEGGLVHAQLDHDGLTSEPVAVELLRHRSRILQRGVVDDDPRARCPVQRWFIVRGGPPPRGPTRPPRLKSCAMVTIRCVDPPHAVLPGQSVERACVTNYPAGPTSTALSSSRAVSPSLANAA